MNSKIELDLLEAIHIFMGEHNEALPKSAVWRLVTIAEEIEAKKVTVKRNTAERVNRQNEMFAKLSQVIVYDKPINTHEERESVKQTSDLGRSPVTSPVFVGQESTKKKMTIKRYPKHSS